MLEKKYCYSFDEEFFHGLLETREEAIQEALLSHRAHEGRIVFFTAEAVTPKLEDITSQKSLVEDLVESLENQAYGEYGEHSEGWPNLPEEHSEALGKMIFDFIKLNCPIEFYKVTEVVEHSVANFKNS